MHDMNPLTNTCRVCGMHPTEIAFSKTGCISVRTEKYDIEYDHRSDGRSLPVAAIPNSVRPENGPIAIYHKSTVDVMGQWGDDAWIARIARHDRDGPLEQMLKFMMKNRHGSPFEFGMIIFKVHTTLFVIQQMLRHRIGVSYSQWSLRWDKAPPEFYIPHKSRPFIPFENDQKNVRKNKYEQHSDEQYDFLYAQMVENSRRANQHYNQLLARGVTQELARAVLPSNQMSILQVMFNPRSLMNFLSLRIDSPFNTYASHPQFEVQEVALQFSAAFHKHWPLTAKLFEEHGRVAP